MGDSVKHTRVRDTNRDISYASLGHSFTEHAEHTYIVNADGIISSYVVSTDN